MGIRALPSIPLAEIDPMSGSVDKDDWLFQRISQAQHNEIDPLSRERSIKIARKLWLQNPLARRMVDMVTTFVVGDGFAVDTAADDEDLRKIVKRFWDGNNLEERQFQLTTDLSLDGTLCLPVAVEPQTGFVKLGMLDALSIHEVVAAKDNILDIEKVVRRGVTEDTVTYNILRIEPFTGRIEYTPGTKSAFYIAINHRTVQAQGSSDLMPYFDWVDLFDQALFDESERQAILKTFVWDVEFKNNWSEEKIKEWLTQQKPPKIGSVRGHNSQIVWSAVAPKIDTASSTDLLKFLKTHIIGNWGFPDHWFGNAENMTAGGAESMSIPTLRMLKTRQNLTVNFFAFMIRFAIEQAIEAGRLRGEKYTKALEEGKVAELFQLSRTQLSAGDSVKAAVMVREVLVALSIAQDSGWIDASIASKIVAQLLRELNVRMSIDDVERLTKPISEDEAIAAQAKLATVVDKLNKTTANHGPANEPGSDEGRRQSDVKTVAEAVASAVKEAAPAPINVTVNVPKNTGVTKAEYDGKGRLKAIIRE